MTRKTTYDESSIKSLVFPDSIRQKPTLYIGPIDGRGIATILREICDNAVDEALAGRNNLCAVFVNDDGSYTVVDQGQGIPVKDIKVEDAVSRKVHRISALQAVFSITHTGGKFHDKAYAASRGTHGLGSKATNALSQTFQVWTYRDGKWWTIKFVKGLLTVPMKASPPPVVEGKRLSQGTVVRFKPDSTCFSSTRLPVQDFLSWCQITAYLTPGLKLLVSAKGKRLVFYEKNGPKDFVAKELEEKKCTSLGEHMHHTSPLCDCVIAFTDYDGQALKGYTNGLLNAEGGVHVNAVVAALVLALKPHRKKMHVFTANELKEGLVGLINAKISSPQFDSQTKEKLVDDRADSPLRELLTEAFTKFFAGNKALARRICDRATQLKELKGKFTASKKVLKELNTIARIGFPSKFSASSKAPIEQRELYLVEGESAGGCYTNDVKVKTTRGDVSFQDLVEDYLNDITHTGYAFDQTHKRFRKVPLTFPRETKRTLELVEISTPKGILRCTPDHLHLTQRGWVAAQDLTSDDVLITQSG